IQFNTEEKGQNMICSFRGSVSHGLTLEIGETVQILEKFEGWFRGFSIKKPTVKVNRTTSNLRYETVVPLEDSVVTEVTSTLQEWAVLWKQLYVKHKVDLFYKLRHVMNELIDLRRQMLSGHLTQDQIREVKRHVTDSSETCRLKYFSSFLSLYPPSIPPSPLPLQHLSSRHSVQQSTTQGDSMRQRHGEACRIPVPHHLFVNLKSFTYNTIGEDTDIFFSLYDLREGKHISEKFMVRLNKNGGPKNPEKVDRLCALFTDLSNKDMKRDLYIVAQVIRTGRMLLNDSKKGPPHVHYRRPYGCAVLAMSDVLQTISELKEEKDFVLKVYTCNNENEWYQIHENIIRKSSTKYTAPSTNYGLIISLQLLRGEMDQVRRENPMIFNRSVAITRKLGFPDVIMPGDIRNDLYLTLERGDFERGGKSVQKNIEITVYVLYADGEILKDCISLGSGEPHITEHRSYVLYHNNSPRWSEVIKLPIPIDRFRGSHLRLEFRHCSTKDKGEKKLFGFAFTPLMREDGTTLSDETLLHQRCGAPSGEEIVKFLQDILDTLFSILDDNTDKYGPLVFQSLVFIINLLRDSKYYHFRPVMDTYIQKHFAGALAYKELIRCLKWYMDRSAEVVRQDHIQEAMRALEYLFKFIVQSRILYSRATCGMEEDQFRTSIQELFQSIRFVLSLDSRNSETLIFTQAALLNSFPAIFDELLQMFTVQEVAEFVRGTLGSMPSTVHIGQSMDVVKLQSIARTVDSRLFSFPESRRILLPVVLHHIHLHLRQQKELLICSGILSSIFSIIKSSSLETSVQEEVEMVVESLLDVLLQTLLTIMSKSQSQEAVRGQRCPQCTAEITGEYVSCLLSLLRQMTDIHFQHLLDNFQSKEELKEFLLKIFCVFRNLMKLSIFPRDWNVMRLLTSNIIVTTVQYLSPALHKNFTDADFDFKVNDLFGPYPSLLEKIEQETWRETGISFVTSVTRLMERLLDYRDCMKGDETENKKIGCTVNLLNFYKSEINKEEMYIRYIHKLCDMHLQAENYTEAAFTLLLYWELLQWEERPLREFLHYPAQSEWHRKEGLCRKVIHYFNKGKCWEYGIPLCRELAFQYESLYDYQSLSWIRKMEAAYYDNIMEQQRLEPEFFRVGFYGRKFPFFLRNKEFVCRGHDYERLEAFQQRMLGEFPQAIAMQHPNQPDEAILQCDAQYLQIYAVAAVPENVDVLQMDRVPDRIKSFYRVNNVRRFRYDRPFHKGSKDKENEFKSLWIERTTLTLTHPLPGISRWFEVEKRELVEVSPLENAISVVENKNQELRTLISQYQHKQLHGNINLLSMCLNGVIDAAVNGGIARYQEAFFDKEYIGTHPEDTEKITQLKDLMQDQVHILGVGLAVHEKLVHPEMRPLHKKLIDQFQMMRSSLCHGLPGLDKLNSTSSQRSILTSHSPMSPESIKLLHRHSPLSLLSSIRHSSSSLSSHTSSETGNLLILTDGMLLDTNINASPSFPPFYQSPLHPIPASPTSPQSGLDGSNSTLSGSASSGVSSLSESNFVQSSSEPPARADTLDSMPSSQAWTTDTDEAETPYLPVRYSVSEPEVLDNLKPAPCRSHSAPVGVTPVLPPDGHHHHPHAIHITHPHYHHHEPPPALPPKPYLREGCIPEEDLRPVVPRPMPRKISQPLLTNKEEQAKVAWEHGISEE
uniref:Dedicator of cytokinesis 3 n=1 Tax=Astyanax mexicanus TaxID=7994 RepID=A0A8B9KHR8_ASTMX